MKSIRCVACRTEFSQAEIEGHRACPKCGDTGVPMAIAEDVTVKINWHELRILCMWAENWARERCGAESHRGLASIIRELEAQRPNPDFAPLTLRGELQQVADSGIVTNVELHEGGKVEKFEPETKH